MKAMTGQAKVVGLIEKGKDGYYACYVEDDLPGFGLAGYGNTAAAAKADMRIKDDINRRTWVRESLPVSLAAML
jgi:hypothetical protein